MNRKTKLIYDACIDAVKEKMSGEIIDIESLFFNYIEEKYDSIINNIIAAEDSATLHGVIDFYISDEKSFWKNTDASIAKTYLIKDYAFDDLETLSYSAFNAAKQCMESKCFLSDDDEYQEFLSVLDEVFDKVSPERISFAEELKSEAVLDIQYAYQKSEIKSLRLARIS